MKAASTLIVSASLLVVVVRLQRLELLGVAKPWKKRGKASLAAFCAAHMSVLCFYFYYRFSYGIGV